MKKLLVAVLCILGFSQCKHKVYSLDNLPKQFIEIGSYGGFAGTSNSYFFFPNGQRFSNSSVLGTIKLTPNEIEKADKKKFKTLLKGLKTIKFKDMELDETGNMTYFVRQKTKKTDKKIQWSNMDKAPKELVKFYRESTKNINSNAIN